MTPWTGKNGILMCKRFTHGLPKVAVIFALVFSLAGCATLIDGRTQTVTFTSDPPGATVEIVVDDQTETITTPGSIELQRDTFLVAVFKKEGHHPTEFVVRGDQNPTVMVNFAWAILFPIGILGVVLSAGHDGSTGAQWKYEDDAHVKLTPCQPGQKPHVILAN